MPSITVEQDAIDQAKAFLTQLLTESFPDADFTEGSAIRDHVINPLSLVIAVMRGQAETVRRAASLLTINQLSDGDEQLAAVLQVASNWFVTPRPGNRVRGTLTLHFSDQRAGRISTEVFFTKFSGLRFRIDQTTARVFSEDDLLPNTNAQGEIEDYILRVPVIAEYTGNAYAVAAGPFSAQSSFSPYLLYVENESDYAPVTEPENAEELAARIPDAITNRDLTSPRSIGAVLEDEFSFIDRLLVQGMADPAMKRDLVSVSSTFANVHVGGHTDIYVGSTTAEYQTYTATVGEVFTDPRDDVTLFTDPTVDDFRRFVGDGALLRVYNGASTEPTLYIVEEVEEAFLRVAGRQPFPDARPTALRNAVEYNTGGIISPNQLRDANGDFNSRDIGSYIRIQNSEEGNDGDYRITDVEGSIVTMSSAVFTDEPVGNATWQMFDSIVDYSVGDNETAYDSMVSRRTTGNFSRFYSRDGTIVLPQVPLLLIREVELINSEDPDADTVTGRVSFPVRTNEPPTRQSGDSLEYQVEISDPLLGGSDQQFATMRIGFTPDQSGTDGKLNLVQGFTAPSALFTSDDVGKTLRIADAFTRANRGEFTVVSVDSVTAVTLSNPRDDTWTSSAEGAMTWELTDSARFNGHTLRVVYDTVSNFDVVAAYAQDPYNKVAAANTLVKSFHPVYVGFELTYTVRPTAASNPDEDAIKATLVNFINTFPVDDVIDVSDIVTAFQNTNPDIIGSVFLPMSLTYTLFAPDGRAIPYASQNSVEIDDAKNTAIRESERLEFPADLSVTDDTVRYLSDPSLITLTLAT